MLSTNLQKKIDLLKKRSPLVKLGAVSFTSPLLLAPMASLTHYPFRQLMQDLGSGGSVSELISCHGINYGGEKTLKMLTIGPNEKNVGIQLFGEDAECMKKAAFIVQEKKVDFIDINMGCPVRKVVNKGGGSALLLDPKRLSNFFSTIRKEISVPLTIKIRTGWDEHSLNADEVIKVAEGEGIEFVAIHGRTRSQQYKGLADWNYIEDLAQNFNLPIIGNGDLHTSQIAKERLEKTSCQALMLARGPLRNPFIFLESFIEEAENLAFTPKDYWEVCCLYLHYLKNFFEREKTLLIQYKKMMVWFATGFEGASHYRGKVLATKTLNDAQEITQDFFLDHNQKNSKKKIDSSQSFLSSGHG